MDRLYKLGLCASLLLALGACQSFLGAFSVDDNLEAAKNAGPPPGAFDAALQQEYIAYSQVELDEYDFEHANRFARKGLAAGNGELVLPEHPEHWVLPPEKAEEFAASRNLLVTALDGGGRTKAPAEAATAQVMFDCWIQEEEIENEGHQPDDIAFCRKAFWDNLALVQSAIAEPMAAPAPEPPPAPEPIARDYLVYFNFDQFAIRPDTASILDRVVLAIVELDSGRVSLIGHTDTAGPAEYNQKLSVERALAVKDYLEARGIPAAILATSGKGETDPRVPTPDGVREQENRRVEIRIN